MTLAELLADMPVISVTGVMPENIAGITKDSREVKEGFVFFATESSKPYVHEATRKGAAVIVSDAELAGDVPCLVIIQDPRLVLGRMAARFTDILRGACTSSCHGNKRQDNYHVHHRVDS
jgi:UDP-N-acetylmuramoyl-L-alanyl-D-glutamate--2,6-diaminopimelate ligase